MQTRPSSTEINKSLTTTADKTRAKHTRSTTAPKSAKFSASAIRAATAMRSPFTRKSRNGYGRILEFAGYATDLDGPMFRLLSHKQPRQEERRHMAPDAIDRVPRKYVAAIELDRVLGAFDAR